MNDNQPLPQTVREIDGNDLPARMVDPRLDVHERYKNWVPFKKGGFGEIFKAWDSYFERPVALKVQRPVFHAKDDQALFRHEITMTAKLVHPGVVPIYDWGKLGDGRIWFAMKLVEGHTITDRIRQLHERSGPEFSLYLRRLLEDFRRLCEPVAYAHEQNIIHRDLKPDNLMIGEFGEVHVMDWALARQMHNGAISHDLPQNSSHAEQDDPSGHTLRTRIAGTPNYMPPEQADGKIEWLGPRSDVYALGAVLYEIICGRPPYAPTADIAQDHRFVLEKVRQEDPISIRSIARTEVPEAIFAICERAMKRLPQERHAHAGELMQAVRDWLDGADREARARKIVLDARNELLPRIDEQWTSVAELRQKARVFLDQFHSYDTAQAKAEGWKMEDDADILEQVVLREEIQYLQKIRSALEEAPQLPEAHEVLAEYHTKSLLRAEERRDVAAKVADVAQIEIHLRHLSSARQKHYAKIVEGQGCLSLTTIPENAEVTIKPYRLVNRSLVLGDPVSRFVETPLQELALACGSYLVQLTKPGYRDVAYPVSIGRNEHWDGVRPGDTNPAPIFMPRESELDVDDIYIPAGFFVAGGDPRAGESLPRKRVWVDAFVIRRFPVTNLEFIAFLNRLVAAGKEVDALKYCPRLSAGTSSKSDDIAYLRDEKTGLFALRHPRSDAVLPVVQIDWNAAMAYARDRAEQTGLPWRLPSELEWEKAARGVDGRYLPWGDHLEPTWAGVAGSHPDRKNVMPIDSYRTDVSPYGVRGMAGNVKDWCLDLWHIDGPVVENGILRLGVQREECSEERLIRGGAWISVPETMRLAIRYAGEPTTRHGTLGFRLARSFIGSS
jgi:eukaryotic-like serine/threonine-protein kinase